jgi:hypothetical protein
VAFWVAYRGLTPEIGRPADKCVEVLKDKSAHLSLRIKKTGQFWSLGPDFIILPVALSYFQDLR